MDDAVSVPTLVSLFPWLAELPQARLDDAGVDDLGLGISRLDSAAVEACAYSLAAVVTAYYPWMALAKLFPRVNHERPLSVTPMPVRAANVLSRQGCVVLGDVMLLSAGKIGDFRNSGANTVAAIVAAVAEDAITIAMGTPIGGGEYRVHAAVGEALGARVDEIRVWGPPDLVALLEELRELSLVLAALGRAQSLPSPIAGFDAAERSTVVDHLLERVGSRTQLQRSFPERQTTSCSPRHCRRRWKRGG